MERYLSIEEACEILRCGRSKTYDLMYTGKLRWSKPAGHRIIAEAEIQAYIESCQHC